MGIQRYCLSHIGAYTFPVSPEGGAIPLKATGKIRDFDKCPTGNIKGGGKAFEKGKDIVFFSFFCGFHKSNIRGDQSFFKLSRFEKYFCIFFIVKAYKTKVVFYYKIMVYIFYGSIDTSPYAREEDSPQITRINADFRQEILSYPRKLA
jgi:hypothetical protein